uniref:BRO1 domain-containing protein n=1 Tax=Percolomonas cosmopolitus TaxID=63605 RepID=A0A7S1KPY6_9EUKA
MFESENWRLCFYIPKPNKLKKRKLMHTSLPHEAASYLNDMPKFTHDAFESSMKSQYVSIFAPFSENKTSKLRFAMKYTYKTPTQNMQIEFSDALIYLILELQNEVYATLSDDGQIQYNASQVEQSMKDTFKYLMRGAGIFDWIVKHLDSIDVRSVTKEIPFELTRDFNTIIRDVLVAQAQEIGVYFSLDKDNKYSVMGKLAAKSFQLYRDAYELLERSEHFIHKEDKTDQFFALRGYLATKMILFDAYTHLQSAQNYNHESQNGEAMYLIRDAQSRVKKAQKVSKKFTSRYWDKDSIKNCKSQIEYIVDLSARCARRFENQNATVFHDSLPDEAPDLLESQQLGKMETLEFPKPDNLEGFKHFYDEMHTGVEEMSLGERYIGVGSESDGRDSVPSQAAGKSSIPSGGNMSDDDDGEIDVSEPKKETLRQRQRPTR